MESKLSIKEKIYYGFGDVGSNLVWTTVSSFLTLYYTDSVGISAATIGMIMLLTRLLDGVSDLVFGQILDQTHSKYGKAKPWLLISIPMMAIGLVLVFNTPMGLSEIGKIAYASITYTFLATIAYTISNLSYNALLSLMTDSQEDRTSASTIRFIMTMMTVILIANITIPLTERFGWGMVSIIYGILASICILITALGVKERYVPVKMEQSGMTFKESFKNVLKNRYFYSILILFVSVYIPTSLTGGIGIYFAKDILGNSSYYGLVTITSLVPVIISLSFFPLLAKKFGKWNIMMLGLMLSILGYLTALLSQGNLVFVLIGSSIRGLGSGPVSAGLFALVGDVIDYGEWKTKIRQDGMMNSVTSFGIKVGTGLGAGLVGWGLSFGQYVPSAAVQSDFALTTINVLYAGLPILFLVIALISLWFTNLDKDFPEMREELKKERNLE